jgi:hypothetical protein
MKKMRRTVVAAFGATLLAAGTGVGVAHAASGNLTNNQTATGGTSTAVVSGTFTVTIGNSATTSVIDHSPARGGALRNKFATKNGSNNANNRATNRTGSQRFTIG